jgi:hypothetical protein
MPRRSSPPPSATASWRCPTPRRTHPVYTFSEPDLSLIRQRRDANRLGVAVQLCLLRFPGQGLLPDAAVPMPLLQWIGRQLRIDPSCWPQYAERKKPGASICLSCVHIGHGAVRPGALSAGCPCRDRVGLANRQGHHAGQQCSRRPAAPTRHLADAGCCRARLCRGDHPRQPANLRNLVRTAIGRASSPP